tara:strand:- start:42 stop:419 length:378 start_codon:yes stop_codon:yes gene_type:complete
VIDNIYYDFDDDAFLEYAMEHYKNPSCSGREEFEEDINRIKYVKRLFGRYFSTGELKERLILNHIIIFYNVFEMEAATKMLFYRMEDRFKPLVKTFLVYLNYLPEDEAYVRVPMDTKVIQILRRL